MQAEEVQILILLVGTSGSPAADGKKEDKMKKLIAGILLLVMITTMGTTVEAAPKKMKDGNVFDAEFYAATYPDVVAALGTSEQALYNHYLNNGIHEGRLPYQPNPYVQLYGGIINQYMVAINQQWDQIRLVQAGMSFALFDYYTRDPANTVGIALIDVDEDGVPELIIGANEVRRYGRTTRVYPKVLAVYTFENNTPVLCGALESNGSGGVFRYNYNHDSLGNKASFYLTYATYGLTPLSMYPAANVQVPRERLIVRELDGNRYSMTIGYR